MPDAILLKRGSLTEDEWSFMRRHVEYGSQILKGIDFLSGASQIVAEHHERYDGSGYPSRLEGERICLGARIFAVADAVDAITSNRPYRAGRPIEAAADELIQCAGKHFDPDVVKAFLAIPIDSWAEIRQAATEPGLLLRDEVTGREIRYSMLTLNGERGPGSAGEAPLKW